MGWKQYIEFPAFFANQAEQNKPSQWEESRKKCCPLGWPDLKKGKKEEKKKTFTFFFCNSAVGGYVNIHFIPSHFLINE